MTPAVLEAGTASRLDEAEGAFLDANQAFRDTVVVGELRATEYGRLDERGEVYLDYTGGGLYGTSQLEQHLHLLHETVYGNPHSVNPTSSAATALVEQARAAVLRYFNAPESEYACIFTPNATGALRLVGESYPFEPDGRFLLTFDNHNSVNGIREFARAGGTRTTYVPGVAPDLRVDETALAYYLTDTTGAHHNLFAYPAQSNFSGVQHPLERIELAQSRGWDVLVDAAAYVPTNRLDLSIWHPDFVAISFYKMFGWPTGVGCLVARRDALAKLTRPWFAGGTVVAAFVHRDEYQPAPGAARFEDGTVNYLNLPAVEIGPPIPRAHRPRRHPFPRQRPGGLAARRAGLADAQRRHPGRHHLRAAILAAARRHDRVQLPASGRARRRRALR
jgi:molybdenum cofactor sulfurtransferase